jgi:hypothetical protein
MFSAYLLAFSMGFISLSQEILWIRIFSFANHSIPQAFAFVLVVYLMGIAIGAQIGRRFCTPAHHLWLVSGVVLLVSGFYDLASPWLYVIVAYTRWQLYCGGILIFLTAAFKSVIFPISHHLGTPQLETHIGRKVSRVYVANIAGATLGPIVTGIFLLDIFTTQHCYYLFAALSILTGIYCLKDLASRSFTIGIAGLAASVIFTCLYIQNPSLLIAGLSNSKPSDFRQIVENSHGIVTAVKNDANSEDIVFGGNVYDGTTGLDPVSNSNRINRLIVLAAIKDHPERVLMIGLSMGSWLKLMTSFPGIKHIDVVEINPGYLQAIEHHYPRQLSALKDARVSLYIDDGRRWLKEHPHNYYDLIVMNTTFNWRMYKDNLLSREFLTLIKQHMKPAAVMIYNMTDSPDALETAAAVFKQAYLYENFVFAADFDWRSKLHDPLAVSKLASLTLDGQLLFPQGSEKIIYDYLNEPIVSVASVRMYFKIYRRRDLSIITDRNLITEYKYGMTL